MGDQIEKSSEMVVGPRFVNIIYLGKNLLKFITFCHSETLVELDIEYKKLAIENGSKDYLRVPAVTANHDFINSLKSSILEASKGGRFTSSIQCLEKFKKCPRLKMFNK